MYTILVDKYKGKPKYQNMKLSKGAVSIIESTDINGISNLIKNGKCTEGMKDIDTNNDAIIVKPLYNWRLESTSETDKDMLYKLLEILYLSDGVIIPIDYDELIGKGYYRINSLKLLYTLILMLSHCNERIKYPNIHFLVYNFHNYDGWDKYKLNFFNKQKLNIHDALNKPINLLNTNIHTTCHFTNNYENELVDGILSLINERISLYKDCKVALSKEFESKLSFCKGIERLHSKSKPQSNDYYNFSLDNIKAVTPLYKYLLDLIKKLEQQLVDTIEVIIISPLRDHRRWKRHIEHTISSLISKNCSNNK